MRLDASGSLLLRSCRGYRARPAPVITMSIGSSLYRRHAMSDALEAGESSRATEEMQQPIEPLDGLFERTNLHTGLADTNLINRQPDLAALDRLNPIRRNAGRDTHVNASVWEKTLGRVMHSFNFHQLEKLCSDADVPRSILAKYKAKSMQRANKEVRAKALLLHRFRMIDPALRAQDQALQKARAIQMQTLEMPISQIALLLLALSGQAELQRLLQAQRVKLLPVKVDKDESLLLILQGSKQSTSNVQAWLSSFLDRIQSITQPLTTYSISDDIHPPDDHRLRLMSQISQTIVSLDKTAQNVTIHSVDEAASAIAETMLSQYLHDAQLTHKRQFHSYASSSDHTLDEEVSGKIATALYAFVPHVGPSPVPWQSDPGTQGSLFRISQQNEYSPGENVFTKAKQDNEQKALLQTIETTANSTGDDPFSILRSRVNKDEMSSNTWSYTAEFGNLLFDNHNRASSSRVLSLVYPPLEGSWPLETGIEWLQQILNDQSSSSRAPSFCSDIPPLAFSLDAGFITPAPFAASARASSSNKNNDVHRDNEKWSEELMRMGFQLGLGRFKNELTNVVNLSAPQFTESIVITYAGKDAELVLQVRDGVEGGQDTSAKVTFLGGEISKRAVADVLVPEASVDLRLSAINSVAIAKEDLYEDEELKRYFNKSERSAASESEEIAHAELGEISPDTAANDKGIEAESNPQPASLPRRVTIKGQDFIYLSSKKMNRWEWPIETEPAKLYNGKIVLERAAGDQKGNYMSSFKIHFGDRVAFEPMQLEEVDKGDEVDQKAEPAEDGKEEFQEAVMRDTLTGGSISHPDEVQDASQAKSLAGNDVNEEMGSVHKVKSNSIPDWDSIRSYIDLFLAREYRSVRGR